MDKPHAPTARIDIAACSDRGLVRSENEDSLAVVSLGRGVGHHDDFTGEEAIEREGVVLAVCDGMGGEAGGEVASRQAVESIRRRVLGAGPIAVSTRMARVLVESLRGAARDVNAIASARPELRRMGT